MNNRLPFLFLVLLLCAKLPLTGVAQHPEAKIKVSEFAPLKETEAQLKYFIEKIGADLSDKAEFGEAEHRRIALDASTVAVLALMLGMHDEESELKTSASKLIGCAGELVDNAESFDGATTVHGTLSKVWKDKPKGDDVSWEEPVADLALLMQQVPIINDGLRRGVNDKRRFKRNAEKTAARAVTLAAIANASMMDTTYCSDEDDEKLWQQICVDMRDACSDVYKALMAKDQDRAKAGNAKVVESCDACHHKFRD